MDNHECVREFVDRVTTLTEPFYWKGELPKREGPAVKIKSIEPWGGNGIEILYEDGLVSLCLHAVEVSK